MERLRDLNGRHRRQMRYVLLYRSVVENLRNLNDKLGGRDKEYLA